MVHAIRLFVRNIRKNRITVLVILVLSLVAGLVYSVISRNLTSEEQAEISAYQEELAGYDQAVLDVQKAMEEQQATLDKQQEYVDNSIFMKLDANSIKQASVCYVISYGEGTNAGDVNTALLTWLQNGGLTENIENKEELETEYWSEVMSSSISSNVLMITFKHYDLDKLKEIISVIKQELDKEVKLLNAALGEFHLTEVDTDFYEKADLSIVNSQNNNRNTLRNMYYEKSDYEYRLNNARLTKANFEKDNRPDAMDKAEQSLPEALLKGGLFGLLLGILLSFIVVFCKEYIFKAEEYGLFEELGFAILGKRKKDGFEPEEERIRLELQLLAEKEKTSVIHFQCIKGTEKEERLAGELQGLLADAPLTASCGTGLFEQAEDLKAVLAAGCCVAVVDSVRITEKDLRQLASVCRRYDIKLLGCVLAE